MHKSELFQKINEIISFEDAFVERLSSIDLTSVQHSHFRVTDFLRLKSGFRRLIDDSRRHKEIMEDLLRILSGDGRDEY